MSIGMSYADYWDGDCQMVKYYREAFKLREKQRNKNNWELGRYIYDALCDVAPAFGFGRGRIQPYLSEPFQLSFEKKAVVKTDEKKKLEKSSAYMMQMALQFNKRRKEKQNGN